MRSRNQGHGPFKSIGIVILGRSPCESRGSPKLGRQAHL